ncbi:MAG: ABC transporter ATP-binding protein, partial [Bacteroidales bacterium]|nr:ABC transporter ATP-binding protein [Bacteroidales bacterium]
MAATIKDYFRWLYSHSKGVRRRIVLNIVLSGVSILLNLFFIYLCKKLVDIATGVFDGSIWLYTSVVLVVVLLRLVVNAMNTRLESLTNSKMNFIIRSRIYSDILQAEWFGKDKYHSGDTLNRLETDVSTVTNVICSDSPQIVSTLFQLAAALVFMCTMDWRLALILLIITPVFVGLSKVFYSRLRAMTRTIRDTESKVQSHLQESIQHRVVIRSMENEDMMENRLENLQNEEYSQVKERTKL